MEMGMQRPTELGGSELPRPGSGGLDGKTADGSGTILPVGNQDVGGVMCNDGNMVLEITATETKGTWNAKHTEYRIKGNDSLGTIDVLRRYSEFFIFHMQLSQRYPGLFIPPIPPKKT